MLSLVLVIQNERERQILNMAFSQQGFKVMLSQPDYQNYVFVMQFVPDLIFIELPHLCIEQLNFAKRIRAYKKTVRLPIIGYGNPTSDMVMRGMRNNGITAYIERPLTFGAIMQQIERSLKPLGKTIEKKEVLSEKEKDVELILDSDASIPQKIEAMVRHVSKLAAFPFTVAKVLHITQDEKSGASQLAQAIIADPLIAAHLLKVSNSVFFASANRRINSIKDAIVRIGFIETKKIVMSMSVMNMFDKRNKNLGFDRIDFWYHSLATALFSERIAKLFNDLNTEEAFLAGLLHDIGIILVDDFFPTIFDKVLRDTSQQAGLFFHHEKRLLNVTHLDLIAELFPEWRMPATITEAIVSQYAIARSAKALESPSQKMAVCIAIGNACAKLLHIGRECDEYVMPVADDIFRVLKMPTGIKDEFVDSVFRQVTLFRDFLGLEKREYHCQCPDGINPEEIHVGIFNPEGSLFLPPALFFKKRQVHYEVISAVENIDEWQEKFHIAVCWYTSSPDEQLVEKLRKLKPLGPMPGASPNTVPQTVPLILFSPDCDEIPADEAQTDIVTLANQIDYRVVESKMCGFFSPVTSDAIQPQE